MNATTNVQTLVPVKYCINLTHLTANYEHIIYGKISPILIALGIFGNICNYLIFWDMSKSLSMAYMKCASLVDLLVCILYICYPITNRGSRLNWFLSKAYEHEWFRIKIHLTLLNSLMKTSTLILVLVCLERYFYLYKISIYVKWCGDKFIKALPWFCFLFSLTLNVPTAFNYIVVPCYDVFKQIARHEFSVKYHGKWVYTYSVFLELVQTIAPCLIIFYVNIKLFKAFRKYYFNNSISSTTLLFKSLNGENTITAIKLPQSRIEAQMDQSKMMGKKVTFSGSTLGYRRDTDSKGGSIRYFPDRVGKDKRILLLLFSFVFSYVVFILPISTMAVLHLFPWWTECEKPPCITRLLTYIFNNFELCNHSLNFYLYLVVDPKFRKNFKQLMSCFTFDDFDIFT